MKTRIEILKALKDNFVYVLIQGEDAVVIDPGEYAPVQKFLESRQLRLTHILCTHHHWDHISGIEGLLQKWPAEVWCSAHDFARIPGATKAVGPTEKIGAERIEILEVPGHTLGQIAYYFTGLSALFPGDTLFSAGCGRLFEGTPEQMFASMLKLRALPPATKIYFGHEYTLRNLEFVEKFEAAPAEAISAYRAECLQLLNEGKPTAPSSLATEMKINPFLNAADVAQFTKWRELRNSW